MADDNDETQGDQTQAGGQPVADPQASDPADNRRRLLLFGIGALLLILLAGALIAVLAGGDDDDTNVASDATTTSSSSTSTSSSTTPPTVPSGGGGGGGGTTPTTASNTPTITAFSTNPNFKACTPSENWSVTVAWTTTNTTATTLSVDGPGVYGNYGPSGSVTLTPACSTQQHTYTLTANGPNGQATKTITFNVQLIPMP